MAAIIVCDLCRRELEPRRKGNYDWVSKGGVVVLVGDPPMPARLVRDGRQIQECCSDCVAGCHVWFVLNRPGGESPPQVDTAARMGEVSTRL